MRTKVLTKLGPSIEVVLKFQLLALRQSFVLDLEFTYLDSNATTNALIPPHTPKLLESSRAIDGRLVGTRSLQDVVCAAVRLDGTLLLSSRRGVVGAIGLNDVVLDERVAGPAVERNVRVYV